MKYISKIAYALVLSLTFITCNEDEDSNLEVNSELVNPMEYVGIEHNKFMAKFTNSLETSYKNKNWTKVEFLSDSYVEQFSSVMNKSYHKQYEFSTSTVEYQKNIYKELDLSEWFDSDETTSLDLAKSVMKSGRHLKSARNNTENIATDKDQQFTNNLLQDIYVTSSKEYNSEEEAYLALEKVVNKH